MALVKRVPGNGQILDSAFAFAFARLRGYVPVEIPVLTTQKPYSKFLAA
jgi:hypothetical protein